MLYSYNTVRHSHITDEIRPVLELEEPEAEPESLLEPDSDWTAVQVVEVPETWSVPVARMI